jgi:hypothetical protein
VLELLDGDSRPVSGAVKNRPGRFWGAVRSHPNVELVFVTEQNREVLFLAAESGQYHSQSGLPDHQGGYLQRLL